MSSDREESMLWKEEPLSPNGTLPSDSGDEWLFSDEKPVVLGADGEEFTFYDEHLTRVQVVTKCLEELDSQNWIKEGMYFNNYDSQLIYIITLITQNICIFLICLMESNTFCYSIYCKAKFNFLHICPIRRK